MSRWTHIVAAIDVDTYIESENLQSDVNELMKYAPKITGSESDADVFINILSGHNVSCWEDGKCHRKCRRNVIENVIEILRKIKWLKSEIILVILLTNMKISLKNKIFKTKKKKGF